MSGFGRSLVSDYEASRQRSKRSRPLGFGQTASRGFVFGNAFSGSDPHYDPPRRETVPSWLREERNTTGQSSNVSFSRTENHRLRSFGANSSSSSFREVGFQDFGKERSAEDSQEENVFLSSPKLNNEESYDYQMKTISDRGFGFSSSMQRGSRGEYITDSALNVQPDDYREEMRSEKYTYKEFGNNSKSYGKALENQVYTESDDSGDDWGSNVGGICNDKVSKFGKETKNDRTFELEDIKENKSTKRVVTSVDQIWYNAVEDLQERELLNRNNSFIDPMTIARMQNVLHWFVKERLKDVLFVNVNAVSHLFGTFDDKSVASIKMIRSDNCLEWHVQVVHDGSISLKLAKFRRKFGNYTSATEIDSLIERNECNALNALYKFLRNHTSKAVENTLADIIAETQLNNGRLLIRMHRDGQERSETAWLMKALELLVSGIDNSKVPVVSPMHIQLVLVETVAIIMDIKFVSLAKFLREVFQVLSPICEQFDYEVDLDVFRYGEQLIPGFRRMFNKEGKSLHGTVDLNGIKLKSDEMGVSSRF